ncbi:MAG: aminotransferase class V-fold PLP-dependent enzyme [Clostridiales bacterium]|jgi:selenocysteine lyase/cysteine desulfurase|nr:aminotransferase class V-fold PLP-dependent enzyme [Clostridiales bacterium]
MRDGIYFDNAATSRFKPRSVLRAAAEELKRASNPGRSGHNDAIAAALKIEAARSAVADALGLNDGVVIFTKNCTEALNLAVTCLIRGHAITTVLDHNSMLRPLYALKTEGKVRVSAVSPANGAFITARDIELALRDDTALIAVNYVSNVTGAAAEVAEIGALAKSRGIPFLVDAAQAIPHFPVSMDGMNIDMVACAGHKGLHGVQGTGFLAVKTSSRAGLTSSNGGFRIKNGSSLRPLIHGGTGTRSDSVFQPSEPPESMESGTLNTPGIAALTHAVKWTYANADKINRRTADISSEIMDGLKKLGAEVYTSDPRAGVISFNVKGKTSGETADFLNERGIAVRSGLHCAPLAHRLLGTEKRGAVRVSVGFNNSHSDARALLSALNDIL